MSDTTAKALDAAVTYPTWLAEILDPCPEGCGCILADDPERGDCGCDGPCTTAEDWPLWKPDAVIPEVEVVPPLCPLCGGDTTVEDGAFSCERCRVEWPNHYSMGRPWS